MLAGRVCHAVVPSVPWPSQAVPGHPVPPSPTVGQFLTWVLACHCMNSSAVGCTTPSCRSSCFWPWSGTWDPWLLSQAGLRQPAGPCWHTPAASSMYPLPRALLAPARSVPLWELSVQPPQQPQSRIGLSHAPPPRRGTEPFFRQISCPALLPPLVLGPQDPPPCAVLLPWDTEPSGCGQVPTSPQRNPNECWPRAALPRGNTPASLCHQPARSARGAGVGWAGESTPVLAAGPGGASGAMVLLAWEPDRGLQPACCLSRRAPGSFASWGTAGCRASVSAMGMAVALSSLRMLRAVQPLVGLRGQRGAGNCASLLRHRVSAVRQLQIRLFRLSCPRA